MQRLILTAVLALAPLTEAAATSPRRPVAPATAVGVAPEGIGCYFERGRTFCSRYCYIEVDGHRFCRTRPREAHSQAPVDELPTMVLTPMK